jgi:hypothetical protein
MSISADADAVYTVDINNMKSVFQFQTNSNDLLDLSSTDLKYYVDTTDWPSFNASNVMMNHTQSSNAIATGMEPNKMLITHDYLRYLAQSLFRTHHGVDLFNNETALLQNIRSICGSGSGNTIGDIDSKLASVSISGTHNNLNSDASGNKYLTNSTTSTDNICRMLYKQLVQSEPSRFTSLSNPNSKQGVPFEVDDIISFKITINPHTNQHELTSVDTISARSYKIKLIIKDTANVSNTSIDTNET